MVGSCDYGYNYVAATGSCAATQVCTMDNGIGTQTWDRSSWGTCQLRSCRSGYGLYDNACWSSSHPTLAVSSSEVAPGGSVLLVWNGGARATDCSVILSDATRSFHPWGSGVSGMGAVSEVTSNTEFGMTCIDAAGNFLSPQPTATVTVDTNPLRSGYLNQMSALNLHRYGLWSGSHDGWEVLYDGRGTPADLVPMAFVWDNPIGDDSLADYQEGLGFKLDAPSAGFLTVDRTNDRNKAGAISRRDELLRRDDGFTLELRVKINPGSEPDAFNAYYAMDDGTVLGLFLSPGLVKAGGYAAPAVSAELDTATDFNVYRIVQPPEESRFYVYLNNSAEPILEAQGSAPPLGSNRDDPSIIIGGEAGNNPVHYTLDYVRYRRGAFPPGAPLPLVRRRMPSPLPPPLPTDAQQDFQAGFDGTFLPTPEAVDRTAVSVFLGYGDGTGWTLRSDGIVEYDAFNGKETAFIRRASGLTAKGDVTLEARIRVLPGSEPRGFSIFHSDEMGTVGLALSADKAELALGIKNVGYRDVGLQSVAMDTTDGFHTYRLVRQARQLYWHLYVDDNPVPAIYDQHVDGSTRLGGFGVLLPSPDWSFIEFGHMLNPGLGRGHVLIDHIRWAPSAYSPPAPR